MAMTVLEQRKALNERLKKLSTKDREFARDLLKRRDPSEKQLLWIGKLIERADGVGLDEPKPTEVAAAPQVSGVVAIVALLERGAETLKRPKVRFLAEGRNLCLSIASGRARFPGSIDVTSVGYGQWLGRVHKDGRFEARCDQDMATAILAALQAFGADPARIASEYGRETGECCFCARELTDPVSVSVGYGPVCADKFGLPHRSTGLTTNSVRQLVAA
jgi:hypothetical protein